MTQLDFAMWDAVGGYETEGRVFASVLDDHLKLARSAEALGWTYYFCIEHQNSPVGRITAPTVWLTAVAAATSRIRIGAMMWQLPFYNPMRLAQEVAMLDHLSHGRVEFGSGIGVHEHEFLRWKLPFYERAPMSEEVIKLVKMAWTQEEVTFEGKYFSFDEALPQPKPFQKPYPPIWAAVHSDTALEWAARNNYHVSQNLDTDDAVARKFDLYRKVWRECKHPGPMPRVFLQRQVHVAETDEQAHAETRKYLGNGGGGVFTIGKGGVSNTRIGWGSNPRAMGRDSERPDDKARGETLKRAANDYQFNIDTGLAVVGSPATVIRKLEEGKKKIGYDVFCTSFEFGEMPKELCQKSMELFGKHVIPAFQRTESIPTAVAAE